MKGIIDRQRSNIERGFTIMKKIMSILLVLTLVFSMVGCTSKEKTDKSEQTTETKTETTAETTPTEGAAESASGEIYNMVMEIVNYGYDDADIKLVEDELNKITEPAIGVHVTFLTVPIMNMGTKLELMVAGGEQMDLVQTGLLTTPNNLAASGLLTPLTKYLAESDTLTKLAGDLLKASTINGEIYAYPANLYPGGAVSFMYDADLAAQYNIKIPEKISSVSDLENIFEQVKTSGMPQYATSFGDGANMEWALGADYEDMGDSFNVSYGVVMGKGEANKVVNWYASEEYKQQCALKKTWFDNGYAVPDSISNGYTVSDSLTQGAIFGYMTLLGTGQNVAYWSAQSGKNLASVPLDIVKISASGVVNLSWGISSNCEKPEKVIDFLELLYTNADVANLISYGIKDKHYVTQENSKIIKYAEGKDAMTNGYGSFIGPFGDSTQIYFREPLTDEFVNSITDYGTSKAQVSKYMGYTFDTKNVQTELTAVSSVITQYAPSLACGIVDPDTTLPEFIQALNDAGMDKIVQENQTQLDAWLATQK